MSITQRSGGFIDSPAVPEHGATQLQDRLAGQSWRRLPAVDGAIPLDIQVVADIAYAGLLEDMDCTEEPRPVDRFRHGTLRRVRRSGTRTDTPCSPRKSLQGDPHRPDCGKITVLRRTGDAAWRMPGPCRPGSRRDSQRVASRFAVQPAVQPFRAARPLPVLHAGTSRTSCSSARRA